MTVTVWPARENLQSFSTLWRFEQGQRVATRQIANVPPTSVIPARLNTAAAAAGRFFERRLRVMMRTFGSPNTPRTADCGQKPGNAYASHKCRRRFADLTIPK